MGRVLYLSLLSFSMMVLFQNCQSFETAQVKEFSSQCHAKIKNKILAVGGWSDSECSNLNHYNCALKVYKPYVSSASFKDVQCMELDGSQVCFDVDVDTHDTSSLLNNPKIIDDDFVEGGNFNRQEYRCMQTGIVQGGQPLIIEVADSLESAFSLARKTCRQGVRL
ncbi:MAG: hypothetical protein H6625_09005 [Bdellovibrionaceae bacterium]|nr:hypothetical protein [Pseudobdellovibrionaceae bacterium]